MSWRIQKTLEAQKTTKHFSATFSGHSCKYYGRKKGDHYEFEYKEVVDESDDWFLDMIVNGDEEQVYRSIDQ